MLDIACGTGNAAGAETVEEPLSDRHARARKIDPRYLEGDLVRVVGAMNLAEAEFIQGLPLEGEVPSTLCRTRGFDMPEMVAAAPRDAAELKRGSRR